MRCPELALMAMASGTDGGYYAIKGFAYQFDKTILEILDSPDPDYSVGIERVEDVDSRKSVLQVKYKETARLSLSALRKPVTQLFNGFKADQSKTDELYVYFDDLADFDHSVENGLLEVDVLKTILGEDHSFESKKVQAFQKKFRIDFGGTFLEQLDEVLVRLQCLPAVNSLEDAVLAHSLLSREISQLVALNDPENSDRRRLSKKQALALVGDAFQHRFTTAYQEYVGKRKYLSQIKRKIQRPEQRHHNLFALGAVGGEGMVCLGGLVEQISLTLFKSALSNYKPPTFIVDDDSMSDVQVYLIDHDLAFNDGYQAIKLSPRVLQRAPIFARESERNGKGVKARLENASFKARLVSESDFLQDPNIIPAVDKAYLFGANAQISESIDIRSLISADGLCALEIKELING